jgi:hypothetical protein
VEEHRRKPILKLAPASIKEGGTKFGKRGFGGQGRERWQKGSLGSCLSESEAKEEESNALEGCAEE